LFFFIFFFGVYLNKKGLSNRKAVETEIDPQKYSRFRN